MTFAHTSNTLRRNDNLEPDCAAARRTDRTVVGHYQGPGLLPSDLAQHAAALEAFARSGTSLSHRPGNEVTVRHLDLIPRSTTEITGMPSAGGVGGAPPTPLPSTLHCMRDNGPPINAAVPPTLTLGLGREQHEWIAQALTVPPAHWQGAFVVGPNETGRIDLSFTTRAPSGNAQSWWQAEAAISVDEQGGQQLVSCIVTDLDTLHMVEAPVLSQRFVLPNLDTGIDASIPLSVSERHGPAAVSSLIVGPHNNPSRDKLRVSFTTDDARTGQDNDLRVVVQLGRSPGDGHQVIAIRVEPTAQTGLSSDGGYPYLHYAEPVPTPQPDNEASGSNALLPGRPTALPGAISEATSTLAPPSARQTSQATAEVDSQPMQFRSQTFHVPRASVLWRSNRSLAFSRDNLLTDWRALNPGRADYLILCDAAEACRQLYLRGMQTGSAKIWLLSPSDDPSRLIYRFHTQLAGHDVVLFLRFHDATLNAVVDMRRLEQPTNDQAENAVVKQMMTSISYSRARVVNSEQRSRRDA